jgi:DNA-binding transcriptional regulator YdaS (Cro superfamily)
MPRIKNSIKNPIFEKLTKEHGGVTNFATFIGVDVASVSKWLRSSGVKVPIKYALAIEMLTKGKVKARRLRPDIMKNYELVAR